MNRKEKPETESYHTFKIASPDLYFPLGYYLLYDFRTLQAFQKKNRGRSNIVYQWVDVVRNNDISAMPEG